MIVVDDGPGASFTTRKGPGKLSPGKESSTQTATSILVLHDSE